MVNLSESIIVQSVHFAFLLYGKLKWWRRRLCRREIAKSVHRREREREEKKKKTSLRSNYDNNNEKSARMNECKQYMFMIRAIWCVYW